MRGLRGELPALVEQADDRVGERVVHLGDEQGQNVGRERRPLLAGACAQGGEGVGVDVDSLGVLVLLGVLAFRRLDRERFFTAVLVLVAATGLASIVAGLAG